MVGDALDHWNLLAEELGAELPAEKAAPQETQKTEAALGATPLSEVDVPSAAPSPPVAQAVSPPRPAPPRRIASDWNRLAEELGVEVPSEPEPEPTVPEEVAAVPAVPAEPDLAWREPSPPRPPESRPERRREEPRRSAADPSRDRDEDHRGRRRRRRRPFEGGEKEGAGVAEPSSQPASPREDVVGADDVGDDVELPAAPATLPSPSKRGEEGGRVRGKRRRRRKGLPPRRESPPLGEEAEVYAESDAGAAAPAVPLSDREESEAPDDYDIADEDFIADDEAAESEARSEKSLHRAIPSWFEAVNLVVSANLESRAKNPDRKSANRPRGGHDRRGGDRGGDRPN